MRKNKIMAIIVGASMMTANLGGIVAHAVDKGDYKHYNSEYTQNLASNFERGIVTREAEIKLNNKVIGYANKYDMVEIISNKDNKYEVIVENGLKGYIDKENVNIVESGMNSEFEELNKIGHVINVTTILNLREKATTSSNILAGLPNNTEVKIKGKQGNWYKVVYEGKEGFVYGAFFTENNPTVKFEKKNTSNKNNINNAKDNFVVKKDIADNTIKYINNNSQEKLNNNPKDKPHNNSQEKLNNNPKDKPHNNSQEKLNNNPKDKPHNNSQEKPNNNPKDKPHNNSQEKPNNNPKDKPHNNSQEKPNNNPKDKPHNNPQEKPNDNPKDKPHNNPQEKPSNTFKGVTYDILKDGHHLYAGGEDNFTELSIGKDLAKASTVKEFLPYVNKAVGYLTMGAYEDKIRDQFVGKTWHGMKIKDCEITTYKVHESHNLDISDEDILKEEGIMNLPKGKFTALAGGYNNMNDDDNIYFVRVVVTFE